MAVGRINDATAHSGSGRLLSIEALRGVAASAVVLCHSARHVDKVFGAPGLVTAFQAGHAGVDLFFVISGFIICFVHRGDIGRPSRLPHYLGRRFNRVMPLYWVGLTLTVTMSVSAGHGMPALATLLWSASLLPSMQEPLLGIAWTLQFEVVFYMLFATMIANRTVGAVLFATWLGMIAAAGFGVRVAGLPPQLWGIFGMEFFLGMAAAQLVQLYRLPRPRLIAAFGAALFVAALVMESAGILDGFGIAARFAYGIPAAMLIAGLATAERARQLRMPDWLRSLGQASYSIYLFQFVFIGLVWQAFVATGLDRRTPHVVLFLTLFSLAIYGGIAMSRWVERPLLRLSHYGFRAGPAQRA